MQSLPHILRADESVAVQELFAETRQRTVTSLSRRERVAECIVGAGFVAAAAALLAVGGTDGFDLGLAVLWTLVFAGVSLVQFDVGSCFTAPSQLALVPMLFVLPPAVVPVCVLVALVLLRVPGMVRDRRPSSRTLLAVGDSWFAVAPAAVLVAAGAPDAADVAAATIALLIVGQIVVDAAVNAVRLIATRGPLERAYVEESAWVYSVDVLLWPVGFMGAIAEELRPGAGIGVVFLAVLLRLFAHERAQRLDHVLELNNAYRGTAVLLGDVVEADHEYTGSHSRSVVDFSLAVADELRLDREARRRVEFGALLHDVGKVRVPKSIIDKPGPLDADEWVIMRRHTIEGEAMLRKVGGTLADAGRVVRSSHEHFDGSGYPDGLAGEAIPLEARIVTCCDAYSAMTTDRSYRSGRSPAEAVQELRACAGSQFDPVVVDALVAVLAREGLAADAAAPPAPVSV